MASPMQVSLEEIISMLLQRVESLSANDENSKTKSNIIYRVLYKKGLLTEAARTWGDRLIGAVTPGTITRAEAEHYAVAFPEVYKQAFTPTGAIEAISIIDQLQDDSVKLVLDYPEAGPDDDGTAQLTWYLAGRSASLSELLPMLQSMGVVVLEEQPFNVVRADGVPVWI